MTISMAETRAAKEKVKRLLAGVAGVAGIGVTWQENGEPAVLVNVEKRATDKVRALLAKASIDFPVQVEEVGPVTFEG